MTAPAHMATTRGQAVVRDPNHQTPGRPFPRSAAPAGVARRRASGATCDATIRTASAASCDDHVARNDLVVAHLGVVDAVVRRLPHEVVQHCSIDDLRSFGRLGLIDAATKWRPDENDAPFAAYAAIRVRGAIFDELRKLDWLPRSLRQRVIAYREAEDGLRSATGCHPSRADVIEKLGLTGTQKATRALDAIRQQYVGSLSETMGTDGEHSKLDSLAAVHDPAESVLGSIEETALRWAVDHLPLRQRTVILYRFFSGMTQRQIAALLGVSAVRVSQLEGAALRGLRVRLADFDVA